MASAKTRANPRVLIPGGLLLLPPAWIVFQGVQTGAGVPGPVAAFTIAGLVAISVILIYLGLQNLAEGDVRDARVQFSVAALILLAEFVGQWWFAVSEGHALVTALIFSMLSLGGGVIVESEIMRVWRANARQDGLMSLARPRVPAEVAKAYPEVAEFATRLAIRYPNSTQSSILDAAFAEYDRVQAERAAAAAKPVAGQVRVSVSDLRPAIGSGKGPDAVPDSPDGDSGEVRAIGGQAGSVSALVKGMVAAGASDDSAIIREVIRNVPGANPETIRRVLRTAKKAQAAQSAEETG